MNAWLPNIFFQQNIGGIAPAGERDASGNCQIYKFGKRVEQDFVLDHCFVVPEMST
jgi:hypothetical protein